MVEMAREFTRQAWSQTFRARSMRPRFAPPLPHDCVPGHARRLRLPAAWLAPGSTRWPASVHPTIRTDRASHVRTAREFEAAGNERSAIGPVCAADAMDKTAAADRRPNRALQPRACWPAGLRKN